MLDLGTEGKHLMEIVAFNEDNLADGTGKAKITWISKTLLNTLQKMNNSGTTSGGWSSSALRSYLKNTIKPLIPATVRNGIVEVSKISSTYENGAIVIDGQTTTDDVWIPSVYEMRGNATYESTGAKYTGRFTSNSERAKHLLGATSNIIYWERSVKAEGQFMYVMSNGNPSYDSGFADTKHGIALGFCTN